MKNLILTIILSIGSLNASLPNFESLQSAVDYLFSNDVYVKISRRYPESFDPRAVEEIESMLAPEFRTCNSVGGRKIRTFFNSLFKAISSTNKLAQERHEVYDPLTELWVEEDGNSYIINELHYGLFVSQRSFQFILNYETKLRVMLELEDQEGLDREELDTARGVFNRMREGERLLAGNSIISYRHY